METDSELIVLGVLLYGDDRDLIFDTVTPDMFSSTANRMVYKAAQEVFGEKAQLDPALVTQKLRATIDIDTIGGAQYVATLGDYLGYAPTVESHIDQLVESHSRRILLEATDRAMSYLQNTASTTDEPVAILETALNQVAQRACKVEPESFGSILDRDIATGGLCDLESNAEACVSTGFYALDSAIRGFGKGELVIIAARPGMGKSSLMLSLAANLVKNDVPVYFLSLEVARDQCAETIACQEANVNLSRLRTRFISNENQKQLRQVGVDGRNWPLTIDDTTTDKLAQLRSKLRRFKNKLDIRVVFVDYLQLMRPDDKRNANREQDVSSLSRGLKLIAKELNITVVAGAQLNRQVESRDDKRPKLADLRESGGIEQDADKVLMLHREIGSSPGAPGIAEIIIRKNRFGPLATVPMTFIPESLKWTATHPEVR